MARLLNKHKTDLTAVCWVCAALTAFGVILTLAIGCASIGGYAVSLAVCIPVYVKKHKRYKAFLNNTQNREAAVAQTDGISAEPK